MEGANLVICHWIAYTQHHADNGRSGSVCHRTSQEENVKRSEAIEAMIRSLPDPIPLLDLKFWILGLVILDPVLQQGERPVSRPRSILLEHAWQYQAELPYICLSFHPLVDLGIVDLAPPCVTSKLSDTVSWNPTSCVCNAIGYWSVDSPLCPKIVNDSQWGLWQKQWLVLPAIQRSAGKMLWGSTDHG